MVQTSTKRLARNGSKIAPKLHIEQFDYEVHHVTPQISSFWMNMPDLTEICRFHQSGSN